MSNLHLACFFLGNVLLVPYFFEMSLVKDMNIYIEPLIDELLKLWVGITMYDISRPIGKRRFQFHGILSRSIHDAPELTHFWGIFLIYFCDLILYIFFEKNMHYFKL
jgi:hypothetical protein